MEELTYRNNLNQDWISLIFFINLIILTVIFKINPSRLRSSLLFYSTDLYIKRYFSEKKFNLISFYNVLCFIIIISTLCLFIISLLKYNNKTILFAFEYYYLFSLFLLVLSVRYILIQFLVNRLNINVDFKNSVLKSFINNFRFALFYLIFLLIVNYVGAQYNQFLIFSFCYLIIWIFYQFRVLIVLFQSNPQQILYLIIYLCTLKLIPWYWFYMIALKPWL